MCVKSRPGIHMNKKGFSLVELIVVMGIIGTILGIATLNFNNWMRKSQIERQTRELFTDLNTARTESIYRKMRHSLVFNTDGTGYIMKRYSSLNESTSAGTTINTKLTTYLITKRTGSNFNLSDKTFMFDTRGMTNDWNTVRSNPVDTGASVDCIVISDARTNMGKMENGSCVFK